MPRSTIKLGYLCSEKNIFSTWERPGPIAHKCDKRIDKSCTIFKVENFHSSIVKRANLAAAVYRRPESNKLKLIILSSVKIFLKNFGCFYFIGLKQQNLVAEMYKIILSGSPKNYCQEDKKQCDQMGLKKLQS